MLPTDAASAVGGRLGSLAGPRLHAAADRTARAAFTALRPDLVPHDAALDAALGRVWTSVGRVYAEFSAEDQICTDDRQADVLANMAALDAAVTPPVLDHLDQWYMLLDLRMDR